MRKLIIILAFLGIYSFASAQLKDVQLWVGPVLKYNLGQKFRFEIEQQFRFNENISQFDYTFSEFGLRYKVFKYLNVKAIYRYSFMSSGQTGSALDEYDKSRVSFSASTGTEIFNTGINVGYRILYQHSWEQTTLEVSNYIRNRFEIDYNLSKLTDPYFNWESYYRLDDKNEFRQDRYTLGLTWKITNKLDIDSFYRFQKEKNVNDPESVHIIGLAAVYTFN